MLRVPSSIFWISVYNWFYIYLRQIYNLNDKLPNETQINWIAFLQHSSNNKLH